MTTELHSQDRAKIVEVAQAMLDEAMGIIEGSRRLNDLRGALGIDHLDEDFVSFVLIDSETDTLPIGDLRKLWNEQALIKKDREVEEAERLYRDRALEGCRKLIARFRAIQRLKYEDVGTWTREDVERALRDDVPEALCLAVIAISMHESDRQWAEDLCIKLSSHRHFNVRGNAVLGFGHIARVHGQLDENVVHPIIAAALRDPDEFVRGQAVGAADDTTFFLGWTFDGH